MLREAEQVDPARTTPQGPEQLGIGVGDLCDDAPRRGFIAGDHRVLKLHVFVVRVRGSNPTAMSTSPTRPSSCDT